MTTSVSATNPHLSILATSFPQATPDCYLHFLIKAKDTEATFQAVSLKSRLTTIIDTHKIDPFTNPAGEKKWTPAHVAAIKGNAAALNFLQARRAITNALDTEGHTAAYYAERYHPELLGYFRSAVSFKDLFPALSPAPAHYKANTNDFGAVLKELLFMRPNREGDSTEAGDAEVAKRIPIPQDPIKVDHLVRNMQTIAKRVGFKLTLTENQYYPRDILMRFPSGSVSLPNNSKQIPEAIRRFESYSLHSQTAARFRTDHIAFQTRIGSTFENAPAAYDDFERLGLGNHAATRFYMEGGDYYCATTPAGETKLIISNDIFRVVIAQFTLDTTVFQEMGAHFTAVKMGTARSPETTDAVLRKTLFEMYTQGLLPPGKGREKGLPTTEQINLTIAHHHHKMPEKTFAEAAEDLGFYTPFEQLEVLSKEDRERAITYITQKNLCKAIIAQSFGVHPLNLVIVPAGDYHLDVFTRPAPNHSMFVQEYALCLKVLRRIEAKAKDLKLTPADLTLLNRYIGVAEKLQREVGPVLADVKKRLEAAGFPVILAPALFYDEVTTNPLGINASYSTNFMNAVTGWSDKLQKYYYITVGAKAADNLGRLIMQSYEEFLQQNCPGIEVHYIGHDPADPSNFTEGSQWINRIGAASGAHCFSFELETATHQHLI